MASSTYLDLFDYRREVGYLLASNEATEVFPLLVEKVKAYYNRPVESLTALRKRDLKTSVGTMWESFCVDWLLAKRDEKGEKVYDEVWTLREWHEHCKEGNVAEGLSLGKNDIGIDLIARNSKGYHAVQCKWRKKGKVTWSELSTFIGLVGRSGPWVSHIIMTNGDGILWKVKRTKKDVSMCKGTFTATKRDQWLSLSGVSGVGHRLTDPVVEETSSAPPEVVDVDRMREARLARFGQQ